MAEPYDCILAACRDSWDKEFIVGTANSKNCSGFVKSVCKALGVPVPETARASEIFNYIRKNWNLVSSGTDAANKAGSGALVIAALAGKDHKPPRNEGHVAIVVPGPLYHERYPLLWGGSTGSAQSKGTKSVGEVWNKTDRDSVKYYSYSTNVCVKSTAVS